MELQRFLEGATMARELPRNWAEIRRDWPGLSVYQRFETTVAFLLTAVIAGVIVIALSRLMITVVEVLIIRALNPLEHETFQMVFGEILTLLIALEFNHTLQYVITREQGIVQARVVLIIAQLALARKVIVTDLTSVSASWLAALAALIVSLGAAYWLLSLSGVRPAVKSRGAVER
jgi:uncharacterized membrane protein (DUF373 family)